MSWEVQHPTQGVLLGDQEATKVTRQCQATKEALREAFLPITGAFQLTLDTSPTTTTTSSNMQATQNTEATAPRLHFPLSHITKPHHTTLRPQPTVLSIPAPPCSHQTLQPPSPPTRSRLTPCKGVPAVTSSKQQQIFLQDLEVKLFSKPGYSPWTGWPVRTKMRLGQASGQTSELCSAKLLLQCLLD